MTVRARLGVVYPDMCTTTSFIKGVGHDTDVSDRIEEATGVPAITTSTAVVKALKALGLKKIATASPYLREVDQKLTEFLEVLRCISPIWRLWIERS